MESIVNKFIKLNSMMNTVCINNDFSMRSCIKIGRMECSLLNYLYKSEKSICMNELSDELKVSHSRITRIVDNLVKKELVTRFPSEVDRRRWFTEITIKGKELSDESVDRNFAQQLKILSKIPRENWEEMYDNMKVYLESYIALLKDEGEQK